MEKLNLQFRIIAVFTIFTLNLAVSGCEKSNPTGANEDEPPDLPPISTFLMDFSDFQASGGALSKAGTGQADQLQTKQNWGWAAFNVGVWNTIIVIGLAVPVASFVESFNHQPVAQADDSWLWTYSFRVAGLLHTAKLTGKIAGGDVQWEMRISKENAYTDFLWYFGVSNLTATEGTWTLNNNPSNPTPLLGIEWSRDQVAGTADVKYTNIVPNGPENGGYIHYGITANTPFDAFYDIFNKGQDNHTNIEWNRSTKEGHVKDPRHFGDEVWHCWSAAPGLDDVTCQ